MNFSQLKQDAKKSLSLANPSPHWVTCLFWCVLIGIIALSECSTYALDAGSSDASGIAAITSRNSNLLFVMLISYGVQMVSTVWSACYSAYGLKLAKEESGGFNTLTQAFPRFFSILLLLIVEYILIMLWSFLFIIPGLMAMYRYRYALLILLENPHMSPIEALMESKKLTQGYKMQIFCLDLHLLWYQILASIGSTVFVLYSYELLPLAHSDWNTYILMAITYLFSMLVDILFMPYFHCTVTKGYLWVKSQQEIATDP